MLFLVGILSLVGMLSLVGKFDFPPLGIAVREDSKFGMLGTDGNGELLPPGL